MTFIIAEVGVNHNNNLSYAYKYIDLAKKIGVNAVKFQIFKTENYVSIDSPLAKYQKQNSPITKNQFELIKKLELSEEKIHKIISYCKKKKIEFLCSIFDDWGLYFVLKNKIKKIKIPSGEINNYPLLEKISKFKKEIILSTGMSTINEIKNAIKILTKYKKIKNRDISILHCHSYYPSENEDLNLNAIKTMQLKFKNAIGFSDHSLGSHAAIAAIAMGANIIEKHITLNKSLSGPDHKASLNPVEFQMFVNLIRQTEKCLGSGIKKPTIKEKEIMKIARKSIVAKIDIKKNEIFSLKNIAFKRPGTGVSPIYFKKILGKKASKSFLKDQQIK